MRAYERFLQYVRIPTASDEASDTCPSTARQLVLAKALVKEMTALGITDARVDKDGYVYGTVPSNVPYDTPVVGFIAHMDVVDEVPAENVDPQLVKDYDGGVLVLKNGLKTDPAEFPALLPYRGKTLVVSDGTTLLGADDKAGIAEIMTAAERLMTDPSLRHGTVKIAFTPDEEIGRGADRFDVKGFGADFAYTLDGAAFGEVEYETFNAYACEVRVHGRSIHPGEAKGKMKNAMNIAMEFDSLLPAGERPEYTEGYEGFYHLTDMAGQIEDCTLRYILRDHDAVKIAKRCDTVKAIGDTLNKKYGDGTVSVTVTESYRNMTEVIKDYPELINIAYDAVRELGGTPVSNPVRGGTDGSRLSFMGLPCPNLGTGSHLHHGKQEFACVEAMDSCTDLVVRIAEKFGAKKR